MTIKYKDEDLIGKKFGRLTVLRIEVVNNKRRCYCKCDCGKEKYVIPNVLVRGGIVSCGCYNKEHFTSRTHGLRHHPLYPLWGYIVKRCTNPNCKDYKNYGARGIKICDEWRKRPDLFINYCLENGWNENLTIDRIDVNGNYEPNNLRFVDRHYQAVNQRLRIGNTSGYKGISTRTKGKTWKSQITINRKLICLGYYDSKKDALDARNKYIIDNNLTEYKIQEWKGN